MNHELALFAGSGGGILGGLLLGWRTVCAVEIDPYARRNLLARQADGCLDPFPIWDDVRTFDGLPWRGRIDIISGGFPCQGISAAGKGKGLKDPRSGLWKEFARIIGEVRPRLVFIENSPMLTRRGLREVLRDLAAMGFDAEWGVVGALHAGAPHKRDRIWIVAHSAEQHRRGHVEAAPLAGRIRENVADRKNDGTGRREQQPQGSESEGNVADADGGLRLRRADEPQRKAEGRAFAGGSGENVDDSVGDRCAAWRKWEDTRYDGAKSEAGCWWQSEPDVGRVAHGVASRVDRLRCIGNGQVPAVAALAFQILYSRILSK